MEQVPYFEDFAVGDEYSDVPSLTLTEGYAAIHQALFADRTSTHEMRSNQLRLYFSSFAYVLMQTLRRLGLEGTSMARAQCDTIRLKLFKIGAHIRLSVRRIRIAFSESYPNVILFHQIMQRLQRIPLRC